MANTVPASTTKACSTCVNFNPMPGTTTGQCRADPPQWHMVPGNHGHQGYYWPEVLATDWCGQWSNK